MLRPKACLFVYWGFRAQRLLGNYGPSPKTSYVFGLTEGDPTLNYAYYYQLLPIPVLMIVGTDTEDILISCHLIHYMIAF